MNITILRKCILSLLCFVFLLVVFHSAPVYAEDLALRTDHPVRDIKGFWELNLYTQTASRTVVEEVTWGENAGVKNEGYSESTRVMARLAAKPWRPVEFHLQAGTATLIIDDFDEYRGDYSLAYGGGISLTLYEYPGPEKFQFITRADTLFFETSDHISLAKNVYVKETILWREYALEGIGIWRSRYWEPFIGARFSWIDSRDTIEHPSLGRLSLKEDRNLGLVLGTNIYFDQRENFAFNAEATLIDQASIKVGIKLWY